MAKDRKQYPKMLGKIGREKWDELIERLNGKPHNADLVVMAASAWELFVKSKQDIDEYGVVLRNGTKNGRSWNNPAMNQTDLMIKSYKHSLGLLGLIEPGVDDDDLETPT